MRLASPAVYLAAPALVLLDGHPPPLRGVFTQAPPFSGTLHGPQGCHACLRPSPGRRLGLCTSELVACSLKATLSPSAGLAPAACTGACDVPSTKSLDPREALRYQCVHRLGSEAAQGICRALGRTQPKSQKELQWGRAFNRGAQLRLGKGERGAVSWGHEDQGVRTTLRHEGAGGEPPADLLRGGAVQRGCPSGNQVDGSLVSSRAAGNKDPTPLSCPPRWVSSVA